MNKVSIKCIPVPTVLYEKQVCLRAIYREAGTGVDVHVYAAPKRYKRKPIRKPEDILTKFSNAYEIQITLEEAMKLVDSYGDLSYNALLKYIEENVLPASSQIFAEDYLQFLGSYGSATKLIRDFKNNCFRVDGNPMIFTVFTKYEKITELDKADLKYIKEEEKKECNRKIVNEFCLDSINEVLSKYDLILSGGGIKFKNRAAIKRFVYNRLIDTVLKDLKDIGIKTKLYENTKVINEHSILIKEEDMYLSE